MLVDGRARPKSYRLEGGEELEVVVPEPEVLEPEQIGARGRRTRTSTCSWSTSPRASSCIRPAATGAGRSRTGCSRSAPRAATRSGPGSSTGSTATPPDCSSSPARRRRTRGCRGPIRERDVERRYLALVRGAPRSRTGRITAAIGRDRRDRTRHSLDTDTPREAVTWFEVRERLGERTLLDVRLETGRTHQIRVHLEAIELPVSGDPVYGVARDLGLERQFLHADRLSFAHPFTGAHVDARVAAPAGPLREALARARERRLTATIPQFETTNPATPPDGGAGRSSPVPSAPAGAPTHQPKGSSWQSSP